MLKVTCALISHHNKVLLAQHGQGTFHEYKWEFPGGKIHRGETEVECILRELQEELGIDPEIICRMEPVEHDYGRGRILLIPFLCRHHGGLVTSNEHSQVQWIPWQELTGAELTEADRKLLLADENRQLLEKYFGEQVNNT